MNQKKINQHERAYLAWNVLVSYAIKKNTITYKELTDKIGVSHHRPARFFLDIIQDHCMSEKLPPLSILVVNQSGLPGSGFVAWADIATFDQGANLVYDFNWSSIDNPFEFVVTGETEESLIKKLVEDPHQSSEVYVLVKSRGYLQHIFRQALLDIYESKCAVCGTNIPELLEAAHIIRWSQSSLEQKLDVRNGILFCSNHHKLYDAGYLIVDETYEVTFSKPFIDKYPNSKQLSPSGKKLRLSSVNPDKWPKTEYILTRNATQK